MCQRYISKLHVVLHYSCGKDASAKCRTNTSELQILRKQQNICRVAAGSSGWVVEAQILHPRVLANQVPVNQIRPNRVNTKLQFPFTNLWLIPLSILGQDHLLASMRTFAFPPCLPVLMAGANLTVIPPRAVGNMKKYAVYWMAYVSYSRHCTMIYVAGMQDIREIWNALWENKACLNYILNIYSSIYLIYFKVACLPVWYILVLV